jgi:hypothetical protein
VRPLDNMMNGEEAFIMKIEKMFLLEEYKETIAGRLDRKEGQRYMTMDVLYLDVP